MQKITVEELLQQLLIEQKESNRLKAEELELLKSQQPERLSYRQAPIR